MSLSTGLNNPLLSFYLSRKSYLKVLENTKVYLKHFQHEVMLDSSSDVFISHDGNINNKFTVLKWAYEMANSGRDKILSLYCDERDVSKSLRNFGEQFQKVTFKYNRMTQYIWKFRLVKWHDYLLTRINSPNLSWNDSLRSEVTELLKR